MQSIHLEIDVKIVRLFDVIIKLIL